MLDYLKYRFKNLLNYNKKQLGEIQISISKKNYKQIKNIRDAEVKVFSQFGEDGIIDFLLFKLNLKKKITFVEIGTGDYEEANTRYLTETRTSKGLLIDRIKDIKYIENRDFYWKNDIYYCQKTITPNNISSVIQEYGFDNRFNLLSIDVDGNDYWILEKINVSCSDIVVAEYNPLFGSNFSLTVPQDDKFDRNNFNKIFYGASLRAMMQLMTSKGFMFIGANRACNNAFFINKKKQDFFLDIEIENLDNYTEFNFRELKENEPKKNEIKYLLNKLDQFSVYDLERKKLIKISDIKHKLFNV